MKNEPVRIYSSKYEKYVKRPLDFVLALGAFIVLFPILLVVAFLVRKKLGKPFIFSQLRPGLKDPNTGEEQIFRLYKFRTMTDERDENGKLLPDEVRLTKFGRFLRSTSLDELPELINIIKGEMAVIGPRPQLVRDMVFMSEEQRKRHTVRPGLSGLAQISGRNAISWENKLAHDIKYIQKITFKEDMRIIYKTFSKVFKREDIDSDESHDVAEDYGEYLLHKGKVTKEQYDVLNAKARDILQNFII